MHAISSSGIALLAVSNISAHGAVSHWENTAALKIASVVLTSSSSGSKERNVLFASAGDQLVTIKVKQTKRDAAIYENIDTAVDVNFDAIVMKAPTHPHTHSHTHIHCI